MSEISTAVYFPRDVIGHILTYYDPTTKDYKGYVSIAAALYTDEEAFSMGIITARMVSDGKAALDWALRFHLAGNDIIATAIAIIASKIRIETGVITRAESSRINAVLGHLSLVAYIAAYGDDDEIIPPPITNRRDVNWLLRRGMTLAKKGTYDRCTTQSFNDLLKYTDKQLIIDEVMRCPYLACGISISNSFCDNRVMEYAREYGNPKYICHADNVASLWPPNVIPTCLRSVYTWSPSPFDVTGNGYVYTIKVRMGDSDDDNSSGMNEIMYVKFIRMAASCIHWYMNRDDDDATSRPQITVTIKAIYDAIQTCINDYAASDINPHSCPHRRMKNFQRRVITDSIYTNVLVTHGVTVWSVE